jgi:hypothetical protein
MVSFTFSAEQIKSAPADVRRWMEAEIVKALSGTSVAGDAPLPDSPEDLQRALAAGTAQEMHETFNRVAANSIVARVFFELARGPGSKTRGMPFHVVDFVDIMRLLQFDQAQQVLACLDAINQAFQQVRRDPQASLFALDEAGHIFLHELTYHAIRQVWQQLVATHPWPANANSAETAVSDVAPTGRQEPLIEPMLRPEHAFADRTLRAREP